MTSQTTYFATISATDLLELKSPYDGGVTAELIIRYRRGQSDVILSLSKGQFIAGVEGESIKVRFDSTRATEFFCTGSSDYDSRVLFISSYSRFIAKLKKAKKVLIEAELYDNGLQLMEFDTGEFKWEH